MTGKLFEVLWWVLVALVVSLCLAGGGLFAAKILVGG